MLQTIQNKEDLESLNELASFQSQVEVLKLQDKLGEKKFHEDMKKEFEAVPDTVTNASEDVTKTLMI